MRDLASVHRRAAGLRRAAPQGWTAAHHRPVDIALNASFFGTYPLRRDGLGIRCGDRRRTSPHAETWARVDTPRIRWALGPKKLGGRTDDNEPRGHSSRLTIEPVWIL